MSEISTREHLMQRLTPVRVAVLYLLLGGLWFLLVWFVAAFFFPLSTTGLPLYFLGGLPLIVCSGVSSYALVRRYRRALTRQRRELVALVDREAYYRRFIDNALDAVITIDETGVVTAWNRQAEAIFGYTRDEILGQRITDTIIPSRYREDHQRGLQYYLQSGEGPVLKKRIEIAALHRDGHEFPVELTIVPMHSGDTTFFSAFVRDISERKRADENIQRMRLYLKNIIDSMPSVLVGVTPDGVVTEWNRQAEQYTGIARPEARGRPFSEVMPQLQDQLHQVSQAISQHQPIKSERLCHEVDGENRYEDVVVYPLIANGALGAVIRVDDVTSRVRIEEMMVQTEKMLSVGGLAAGMAHEINNPLGAILQGCQNIQRRISLELPRNQEVADQLGVDLEKVGQYLEAREVTHFLEGMREAGARAAKIVSDMLAFSRHSESRFTRTDLAEVLEIALRLAASDYDLKKRYDFKRIEIVREYDNALPAVECDANAIEQVILNLLKNAAQAMAQTDGKVPHRIRLRTCREGDYARIEIIDTGPGMNEQTRKRAFEPFFTTKEVGVGTGLGLSVSYFIITEQHRGTMTVQSQPGEGARFIIKLPFRAEGVNYAATRSGG